MDKSVCYADKTQELMNKLCLCFEFDFLKTMAEALKLAFNAWFGTF